MTLTIIHQPSEWGTLPDVTWEENDNDLSQEKYGYVVGYYPPHYLMPVLYDDPEMYRRFGAWFIDWSRGKLERY